MSVGSKRSYRGCSKGNWRSWVWSRIGCMEILKSSGPIIYLAGPEDNDRAAAARRGVSRNRLIAVDRDENNIAKVKQNGGLGIAGELASVLAAWPESWPVSAIVADFCSGVNNDVADFIASLLNKPLHRAAVCMTLLRGRDKGMGQLCPQWAENAFCVLDKSITPFLQRCGQVAHNKTVDAVSKILATDKEADSKHRGLAAWAILVASGGKTGMPCLYSYRSDSGQIFDTVAFVMKGAVGNDSDYIGKFSPFRDIEKSLIAIKAHFTRRQGNVWRAA